MTLKYESGFEVIGRIGPFTEAQIRAEPPCGSRLGPTYERGGPITRAFIEALPAELQRPDTTIRGGTMWAKAGWAMGLGDCYHFDHWCKTRENGEYLHRTEWRRVRDSVLMSTGVARTRFVCGTVELPEYDEDDPQGSLWHHDIRERIAEGQLVERAVDDCTLVRFGYGDLHTSPAAEATGWRFWIKATRPRREDKELPEDPRPPAIYNACEPFYGQASASSCRLFVPYAELGPY